MTDRKFVRLLTALCAAVYGVSYITRINFAVVLVEIITAEGYSKTALSAALTGLFIAYGAGQLVSGWLGDRISPRLLIAGGLGLSAAMNILIPICPGTASMTAVWSVNGLAQAMMWPPLMKTIAGMLNGQDFKKVSVKISWGSSFGTIIVYLLAPLCISISGWQAVFYISGSTAVVMMLIWLSGSKALERYVRRAGTKADDIQTSPAPVPAHPLRMPAWSTMGLIVAAIIIQGTLRDGITTWMPSCISETFGLQSNTSILTGVALPVFSIISYQIASLLNRRFLANEVSCATAMYFTGAFCCGLLSCFGIASPVLTVFLLTTATGCMHGVNVMLICMLPPYFRANRVSTISGALNACTYLGSAISMYGVSLITELAGWQTTIGVWTAAGLTGAVLCAVGARGWERYRVGLRLAQGI